jgi:DNA invertase Pin-like site-specific DNA recombinase
MKHQVVGYIRVSSQGQNTARQLVGIEVDRMFTDIMTGSIKSRPELDECLKYVRDGDTLIVDSIDRLARNLLDLQKIVSSLIDKGVTVKFIKENISFSRSHDAMANLTLHIMGAFAEFERNMIRSRQREGIDLAKKAGKKLGRPAVLNGKHKKQAKELREQGMSIRKIAMTMSVCRASIYKLLDIAPKP